MVIKKGKRVVVDVLADDAVNEQPLVLEKRDLGPLTILFGKENGKYPHGNSLLITGTDKTAIVDPCLGVVARKGQLPAVDMILLSHVHEDHVAGTHLFPNASCHAHEADAVGMTSIDGMLDIYGFDGPLRDEFKVTIENEFFFEPRADVIAYKDGEVFDLGGVTVTAMHTPGHTRGHTCFLIEWESEQHVAERLVYLGDIELTGFGPYYGDAWSNLEDFERSLAFLKTVDAQWWLTFHHKGLIESRAEFLVMLESFRSMIDFREGNLLRFIEAPRTMDAIVEHRFVYRPGTGGSMADQVERRSMGMHLERLVRDGRVEMKNDRYSRVK
jgi:glyoxylase-like metal-dependent hydrolase (beta-lactamase superfamily II)